MNWILPRSATREARRRPAAHRLSPYHAWPWPYSAWHGRQERPTRDRPGNLGRQGNPDARLGGIKILGVMHPEYDLAVVPWPEIRLRKLDLMFLTQSHSELSNGTVDRDGNERGEKTRLAACAWLIVYHGVHRGDLADCPVWEARVGF